MNGIYHIKSDVPHSPLVTYSHVSIFMQISTPLLRSRIIAVCTGAACSASERIEPVVPRSNDLGTIR